MAMLNGDIVRIDASEVTTKANYARMLLGDATARKVIYQMLGDTAHHVKTIVGRETVKDYATTQASVKADVGSYSLSYGDTRGLGVVANCTIPIRGTKGVIGGRFTVSGARGRPAKGAKRKIRAKIVKTGISELPDKMTNQGGNAPFIHPTLGIVMTRRTKKRYPIVRVVALGSPQFPLNRSEGKVKKEILEVMNKRFEHYLARALGVRGR